MSGCDPTCAPHLWMFCSPECEAAALAEQDATTSEPALLREAAHRIRVDARVEGDRGIMRARHVAYNRAVAALLDGTAELIDHDVPTLRETALAVARAYLGQP